MKYSFKTRCKIKKYKFINRVKSFRLNVKGLVIGALVLAVAFTGYKFLSRDKEDINAFEVNNAGVKVISKDARKLLADENTTAKDVAYIINNWDEVRACDKARYGRRIQAMDSNIDYSIIAEEDYINSRYKEESEYVSNLNKEMHRIINATQSIIELYNGFSVVDDSLLPEDIREEILFFNQEIIEGYENIKALGKRERFETFYMQFDKYYREKDSIYEAVEKAMLSDAKRSEKEIAYNLLHQNYDNWNYVINLYN